MVAWEGVPVTTYQDAEGRVLLTPWEAMHQAEVRRRFRVRVSLDCQACCLLDWLGTTMRPGLDEPWPKMLTEPCKGADGPCLRLDGQRAQERGMRALLAKSRRPAMLGSPLDERAALAREMMAADPLLSVMLPPVFVGKGPPLVVFDDGEGKGDG